MEHDRLVRVFQQKEEWTAGHFQGDILLQDDKLPVVSCFNAVCCKDQLWPNATMYYCIHEKYYNQSQIDQIQEAAREIQNATECINIFRVSEKLKENYLDIQPSGCEGCATFVGKVGGAQQFSLDRKSLFNIGTVMHVFLHALGLHHEHIREDRDNYIDVHWANIPGEHWKNFSKVDNTLISHYDCESLMHWGSKPFAKSSNLDSLAVKNVKTNARIGVREKLSEMDIERLQVLYGKKLPKETKYFKTFSEKDLFKPTKWVHKNTSPTHISTSS